MLKQIDFTLNNIEYSILYDSDHMTQEQAIAETEFVGWGGGCNHNLYPYYLIVEKGKSQILKTIRDHVRNNASADEQARIESLFNELHDFISKNKAGQYSPQGNYLGQCVHLGLFENGIKQLQEKYLKGDQK